MTTVWNTTTETTYELDVNCDVLGNGGVDAIQPWASWGDTEWMFALSSDDIEWWEQHPEGIE